MKIQFEYRNLNIGTVDAINKPRVGDRITMSDEIGNPMHLVITTVIPRGGQDDLTLVVLNDLSLLQRHGGAK